MRVIKSILAAGALAGVFATAGCTIRQDGGGERGRADTIRIDGSSTVEPISQAVAEEFRKQRPDVRVLVGLSGTGGGFKKFALGETDINDASRPISESEVEACRRNSVEFVELKVAIDGLSVVVNPQNDWVDCLTVDELKAIWQHGSTVGNWSDVNPEWPDERIRLYGADTESGTFDYFTEEITGETGNIRADYTASSDDNVLVKGVAGDRYALGFFGYAYYAENRDRLKVVAVEAPGGQCVRPTPETIEDGSYTPLSRPLFLYVNRQALRRPELADFLRFYLSEGQVLVREVGYVRLGDAALQQSRTALEETLSEIATQRREDAKVREEQH